MKKSVKATVKKPNDNRPAEDRKSHLAWSFDDLVFHDPAPDDARKPVPADKGKE